MTKHLYLYFLFLIAASNCFGQSNSYLGLKDHKLRKIPDSLLSYQSIDSLDLSINLLRKVDFAKIPNSINYLDLGYNPIKKIEGVCKLTQLTELSLMHTYINKLPDCICEMPNLQILQLVNIRLKKLPDCLKNNRNLKLIILEGNTPAFSEDYKRQLQLSMPNCKLIFDVTDRL